MLGFSHLMEKWRQLYTCYLFYSVFCFCAIYKLRKEGFHQVLVAHNIVNRAESGTDPCGIPKIHTCSLRSLHLELIILWDLLVLQSWVCIMRTMVIFWSSGFLVICHAVPSQGSYWSLIALNWTNFLIHQLLSS